MPRKAAVLDGDRVVNVILVEGEFNPGEGFVLRELPDDSRVGPGWSFLGDGLWSAPTPPVVEVVLDPVEALAARLAAQEARVDALLLGGLTDDDKGLDDVLDEDLADLPDTGGSLDDLPLLDLPDTGESLDDLLTKGA